MGVLNRTPNEHEQLNLAVNDYYRLRQSKLSNKKKGKQYQENLGTDKKNTAFEKLFFVTDCVGAPRWPP